MSRSPSLSETQIRVLRLLRKAGGGPLRRRDIGTGIRPVHYSTLESLERRGFVSGRRGGDWVLTSQGYDVVELWITS